MQFTAEKVFRHRLDLMKQLTLPAYGSNPVDLTPEFAADAKNAEVFCKFRADCYITLAADQATAKMQIETGGNRVLCKEGEVESFYNTTSGKSIFAVSTSSQVLAGVDCEIYHQGALK